MNRRMQSAECGVRRTGNELSIVNCQLGSPCSRALAAQGLMDFETVAERCGALRNFPKLSVSFRFVPGGCGWCRPVPAGY